MPQSLTPSTRGSTLLHPGYRNLLRHYPGNTGINPPARQHKRLWLFITPRTRESTVDRRGFGAGGGRCPERAGINSHDLETRRLRGTPRSKREEQPATAPEMICTVPRPQGSTAAQAASLPSISPCTKQLPDRGDQPDGILVAMMLEPRNERGDQPEFEDEPAPAERPATNAGIIPDSRAANPRNHPVTPAPAGSKPHGCRLCRRKITPPPRGSTGTRRQ